MTGKSGNSTRAWAMLTIVAVGSPLMAGHAQGGAPAARPAPAGRAAYRRNLQVEQDWLFQAGGTPLAVRATQELGWTRKLAARLAKDARTPDLSVHLKELDELAKRHGLAVADRPIRPARDGRSLPEGLIARWTFDDDKNGTVKDCSTGGHNGKVLGRADYTNGVFARGLSIASGNMVNVGKELAAVTKGNYTFTAWIKTTSGEADILGNGTAVGHVLLMTYRGVVRGHHWTASSGNVIDGKIRVNDGRWHHVAQVVDGKSIRLFVDGKLDATMTFRGSKSSAPSPLVIGGRSVNAARSSFAGLLDEVCVFDRPLSAEQVQAEWNAGKAVQVGPALTTGLDPKEFYLAVRHVKRQIMFKNPVVDFTRVMFIDNPFPAGGEWPHQARHRNGMMAVPGGRLLVLDGLSPDGKVLQLAPERGKQGSFWRPDLSFDAKRVLFCMKPAKEKSFHLYEINTDGTGLRQLTNSDYDDLDPIYLPSGKIIFVSTRGNTYIRCMPYTYCYTLARCDADGRNVYVISRNNECDWVPALLNDGRVIYSRWEYHDKALWRIQSLWSMNQDGTNVATFWGNQSVWPDHLAEARPIPGSGRVMFTGLAHHNWFAGSIGILDPRKGFNFPHGLTKVTADVAWPECGRPPRDPIESPEYHRSGNFNAYKTPYPLSEKDFLVSAQRGGKFMLYLMDVDGNRELIYTGKFNVWHAMPVKPRKPPPQHADRVAWPGTGKDHTPNKPGMLFSADVYQGVPDLARGKVKYLRVIQMDHRTYSTWNRDGRFSGPVVSAVQDDGVKRILGTVPVEVDGSVSFEAPPGVSLHFQALDEHYRALQTMRSFSGVMPGERRGCVGCHELHSVTPAVKSSIATRRPPRKLTPPPWGAEVSIGYERLVQPVLDKHCGKCHQGSGEGRKKLDLTLRPGKGVFKEPYLTLIGRANYFNGALSNGESTGIAGAIMCENFGQSDPRSYVTFRPMKSLSYTSKLIDIAMSGKHHDVKVTGAELRQLIGWVDANCPFRGDKEIRAIPDPDPKRFGHLPILPRTKTAPVIDRFNIPQDHVPAP